MRRRRGLARPRKGFSLVELVIALMLLTFGLLSLASAMASTIVGQRASSSRNELGVLAEAKLEELRGYGSTIATDPLRAKLVIGGSVTTSTANYVDTVTAADDRAYIRRWAISAGVAGTRRVTIRVGAQVPRRSERRFESYTSLIALR
jgi:Tfp pilus assembly protein PilV